METYFCLDVGGTQIKAAATDREGVPLKEILSFDARSGERRETILKNFEVVFERLKEQAVAPDAVLLAFPGNFDYENGVCLMENVGKYDGLYGVNLKTAFAEMLETDPAKLLFVNDVTAFAVGDCRRVGAQQGKTLCVCIGTGCGSAFLIDGRPAPRGTRGMPENGWIYGLPFREGRLDDYLSRRGIQHLSGKLLGRALDGLELALLVQSGGRAAMGVFQAFGETLAEGLTSVIDRFQPDTLLFGGQIGKSFAYFGSSLQALCEARGVRLQVSPDTSLSVLSGLAALYQQ